MRRCLLLFLSVSATTAALAGENEDLRIAVEAILRGPACAASSSCEPATGCLIPPSELAEPGQPAASLEDPSGLFNSSLEGNTRRAIDFREGDKIDEEALKALIRAAVALNISVRAARPVRSQKGPKSA